MRDGAPNRRVGLTVCFAFTASSFRNSLSQATLLRPVGGTVLLHANLIYLELSAI